MKRWRVAALAVTASLFGACTSSPLQSKLNTQNNLRQFRVATQRAIECRTKAAQDPRYQVLREQIPLTNIDAAQLSQMADQKFATKGEILALDSWTGDVNACLERLLREVDTTIPSFGPIIEASWNDDNTVFVKLAHHQTTWGDAIMSLKRNKTKLRTDLIARADQVAAEVTKMEQAQFNRRTAIISSVIGILP